MGSENTSAEQRPERPVAGDHGPNCLQLGTRLGEFEVTGLIGEGGFGIVYAAKDHLLEREIAIKEYMPSALASRTAGTQVTVKSERHAETFAAGLRSFVNEAKLLAQFDHPALVKVYRFWEANGTAYMVMPYYRGRTLRGALAALGARPTEAWIVQFLHPLLDALELIHEQHCFHRDIAPDNILILGNGRPVLLDFGAARRVIGDITQALTVILKPGFAPFEQYASGPEMRQGPWTDIYALAAVVYYCITGKAPVQAPSRLMKDTLVPARIAGAGAYSERFLAAIDHALALRIEDRTHSIAQLRDELGFDRADAGGGVPVPGRATPAAAPAPTTVPAAATGAATAPATTAPAATAPAATAPATTAPATTAPATTAPVAAAENRAAASPAAAATTPPAAIPAVDSAALPPTPAAAPSSDATLLSAPTPGIGANSAVARAPDELEARAALPPVASPPSASPTPVPRPRPAGSPVIGPIRTPLPELPTPAGEARVDGIAPRIGTPAAVAGPARAERVATPPPAASPAARSTPEPDAPPPERSPAREPARRAGPAAEPALPHIEALTVTEFRLPEEGSAAAGHAAAGARGSGFAEPDARIAPPPAAAPQPSRRALADAARAPRVPAWAVAAAIGVAAIAGTGVWWSARESTPITEQSPGPAPSRSPATAGPVIAQAPAGAPDPGASTGRAPASGTAPVPPATSTTPAVPGPEPAPATGTSPATPAAATPSPASTAKAAAEFSPHGALDAIHAARDPGWGVDVKLSATSVRIGRDPLRFEVRSARPGYLYVLMVGTDASNFFQLFPNAIDGDNRVEANTTVRLPREGWQMKADGPPGTDRFVAMVSPSPRQFSAAGLKAMSPFSEFDLNQARKAFASAGPSVFAGTPERCAGTPEFCASYGAASFEIREIR